MCVWYVSMCMCMCVWYLGETLCHVCMFVNMHVSCVGRWRNLGLGNWPVVSDPSCDMPVPNNRVGGWEPGRVLVQCLHGQACKPLQGQTNLDLGRPFMPKHPRPPS